VFNSKYPTDLNILTFIYETYYDEFCRYDEDETIRAGKVYVPISCSKVAENFGVNGDIIFGRLYYHLANKYKYQHEPNVIVKLFEFEVDGDLKCIHFPYLASVVSDLRHQNKRYKQTFWFSVFAAIISIGSLSVTVYDKFISEPSTKTESVALKKYK